MYYNHVDVAAVTDTGRRRSNNEDAVLSLPDYGVFCVADGMGGAEDGEVASRAVVDALKKGFEAFDSNLSEYQGGSFKTAHITKWLNEASRWIYERAVSLGHKGSGSTVVLLFFDAAAPDQACCMHAGDSRAYRYRSGTLQQLMRDHSMAEESGKKESDLPAMMRGVITRAVGVKPTVQLERTLTDVREGDVFLICSDGLTKMLKDGVIAGLLAGSHKENAKETAARLVAAANTVGGVDNISVVVVKFGKALPPPVKITKSATTAETAVTGEAARTGDTQDTADTDAGNESETPTTGDGILEGRAIQTPTDGWSLPHGSGFKRLISRKNVVIPMAALLMLGLGLFLYSRSKVTRADERNVVKVADKEILSKIKIMSAEPSNGLPPMVLSLRDAGHQEEFGKIEGRELTLASGKYEILAAKADYVSFKTVIDVGTAGQELSVVIPELQPEPVLQRLRDAQQALVQQDFQTLGKVISRESLGILQFSPHKTEWQSVESAFELWKASQQKEASVFMEAKAGYEVELKKTIGVNACTVAEAVSKFSSEDWKDIQNKVTQAEAAQDSQKYKEALVYLQKASKKAVAAMNQPARLIVSSDIQNSTVWLFEKAEWRQIGLVGKPLLLEPFVSHKLEVRAEGCETQAFTVAAKEPGVEINRQVVLRKIPTIVAAPVRTQPSAALVSPSPLADTKPDPVVSSKGMGPDVFIQKTAPFIQYALSGRLAQFKKDYLLVPADELENESLWSQLKQMDSLAGGRTGCVSRLYEAVYWRIVSDPGGQAKQIAVRSLKQRNRFEVAHDLETVWDALKTGEASAKKDFYNWLVNEAGYKDIERFVRLSCGER